MPKDKKAGSLPLLVGQVLCSSWDGPRSWAGIASTMGIEEVPPDPSLCDLIAEKWPDPVIPEHHL